MFVKSNFPLYISRNRTGGVMVKVLALSAVDRGFDSRSGQTKDYNIGICCFSAKQATLRRKSQDYLSRNQDNVSEWGDMSIKFVFSELALLKSPTKRVDLRRSAPHHHLIEN